MQRIEASDEEGRPCPSEVQASIWLHVPLTRRKYFHLISNPQGEIVYSSQNVEEILGWLEDNDITRWRFCTQTRTFGVERQWCRRIKGTE